MTLDNSQEFEAVKATRQGFLQKISVVSGYISFLLAVVSAVILYFKVEELGTKHPVSASFAACCFFFVFVGIVLTVMGRSNVPSFRFDKDQPDK